MTDAHEAVIRAVMEDFCDEPWFDAETLNILARGNLGFNPDITPAVFVVRLGRQLACVQRLREAEAEAEQGQGEHVRGITVEELAELLKDPVRRAARLRANIALNREIAAQSAEIAVIIAALAANARMSPGAELAEWGRAQFEGIRARLAMRQTQLGDQLFEDGFTADEIQAALRECSVPEVTPERARLAVQVAVQAIVDRKRSR
jgi:hypothetical protein